MQTVLNGLVNAHREMSRRADAWDHRLDHLGARVTALDGQVGGGDEHTSIDTAESAGRKAAAAARVGEQFQESMR